MYTRRMRAMYATRPVERRSGTKGNSDPRDFDDLVEGNRRRAAGRHRRDERRGTVFLAFVLLPQATAAKARPAEPGERAEIIELQDAPLREHFDTLFGER